MYLLGQFLGLGSLLFIIRRHMYRKQMAQHVDRHMDFAFALALVAVIPCSHSAFAGRLQGASIENHRIGLALPCSIERRSPTIASKQPACN